MSFLLQFVPNGLIYILAGYTFAQKPVNRRDYLLSSMILAVFGLVAKVFSEMKLAGSGNSLPQILILFACVFLLIYINRIPTMYAIVSTLSAMLLQLVFEMVYMVIILEWVFRVDMDLVFDQSNYIFSLIGLPSISALGLFMLMIYKVMMKRRNHG